MDTLLRGRNHAALPRQSEWLLSGMFLLAVWLHPLSFHPLVLRFILAANRSLPVPGGGCAFKPNARCYDDVGWYMQQPVVPLHPYRAFALASSPPPSTRAPIQFSRYSS